MNSTLAGLKNILALLWVWLLNQLKQQFVEPPTPLPPVLSVTRSAATMTITLDVGLPPLSANANVKEVSVTVGVNGAAGTAAVLPNTTDTSYVFPTPVQPTDTVTATVTYANAAGTAVTGPAATALISDLVAAIPPPTPKAPNLSVTIGP